MNQKRRKYVAILMVTLGLVVLFTACGNNETDQALTDALVLIESQQQIINVQTSRLEALEENVENLDQALETLASLQWQFPIFHEGITSYIRWHLTECDVPMIDAYAWMETVWTREEIIDYAMLSIQQVALLEGIEPLTMFRMLLDERSSWEEYAHMGSRSELGIINAVILGTSELGFGM
ncbi:MAG: hypothetical protein FWE01_02525 [Firmicutes bacterium]|nr:hypothetical protein [Bacillota bacterium]